MDAAASERRHPTIVKYSPSRKGSVERIGVAVDEGITPFRADGTERIPEVSEKQSELMSRQTPSQNKPALEKRTDRVI